MRLESLHIGQTDSKGRGVFTSELIPADTVIEIAPVIVMSLEDRKLLDRTKLYNYIFLWGEKEDRCAMALGWIPVYNHSYQSNCEYFMDFDDETMFVKTVRLINANEELTINYSGDWNDGTPVWLEAKE